MGCYQRVRREARLVPKIRYADGKFCDENGAEKSWKCLTAKREPSYKDAKLAGGQQTDKLSEGT